MDTRPLSLDDHDLLFDRLRSIDVPISEFSFANLYLFRDTHRYEIVQGAEIFIRGRSYGGETYIMPTRDVREVDPRIMREMAAQADYLYPIAEEWLSAFASGFETTFDEGDSDYLYLTERIATYAGKKLHRKKNLLNFFRKHYRYEALPLTEDRIPDAIRVLNEWQEESGKGFTDTDFAACRESLVRMEELALCGGIYYTEGEPSGFVHGEELNGETYALHFAKALKKYKGIYQYIFSSFAGILPKKYRYLNFEQDLGKEALRHSKESYFPEMKLRKYRVSLKR
ncbi:MAG: DUF2156 domain-containing protein [bacterium]|nr:MAG: DUF2156 domain-containing protein [bacterium]